MLIYIAANLHDLVYNRWLIVELYRNGQYAHSKKQVRSTFLPIRATLEFFQARYYQNLENLEIGLGIIKGVIALLCLENKANFWNA